jgi:CheY-like chemotaxis protein
VGTGLCGEIGYMLFTNLATCCRRIRAYSEGGSKGPAIEGSEKTVTSRQNSDGFGKEIIMTTRILLASSARGWRELHQQFLCSHGFEVETAADGLDCVRKIRRFKPHVVVVEWEMPWGGGDGVLAWLHEEYELLPATVMIVSGNFEPENSPECCDSAISWLRRPFRSASLLDAICESASMAYQRCT